MIEVIQIILSISFYLVIPMFFGDYDQAWLLIAVALASITKIILYLVFGFQIFPVVACIILLLVALAGLLIDFYQKSQKPQKP